MFILVVLGTLSLFIASIAGTQHFTTLHAHQGAKAYHAARSGVEWAIYQAVNNQDCNQTLSIDEFAVVITCHQESISEGSRDYTIYRIASVASTGDVGSSSRSVRKIETIVHNES